MPDKRDMLRKVINDPYIETLRHLRGICRAEYQANMNRCAYLTARIQELDIDINKRLTEVKNGNKSN